MPGTLVIGGYELLKRQAAGNLPVVRGQDAGKRFVVSVHRRVAGDEEELAVAAAHISAASGHPHLPQLVDTVLHREAISFVFAPVPTGWLCKRLFQSAARHFSTEEARAYIQQLAYTLKFLHDRGMSHGAIGPHDLLLKDSSELVLFGAGVGGYAGRANPIIARDVPSLALMPEVEDFELHYDFRAPELIANGGVPLSTHAARVRCDMYALGALLHAMLRGTSHRATSDSETSSALADSPNVSLANAERALIDTLLLDAPEKRREMPAVLANEWFLGTDATTARTRRRSYHQLALLKQQQEAAMRASGGRGDDGQPTEASEAAKYIPAVLLEWDAKSRDEFATVVAAAKDAGVRRPDLTLRFFGTVADFARSLERKLGFHTFAGAQAVKEIVKPSNGLGNDGDVVIDAMRTDADGSIVHVSATFAVNAAGDGEEPANAGMDSITSERAMWDVTLRPVKATDARVEGLIHELRRNVGGIVAKSNVGLGAGS